MKNKPEAEPEIIPCPKCGRKCKGNRGFGQHISRMHPLSSRVKGGYDVEASNDR